MKFNYLFKKTKNLLLLSAILSGLSCANEEQFEEQFAVENKTEDFNVLSEKSVHSIQIELLENNLWASRTKLGTSVANVLDQDASTRWSAFGTNVAFEIALEEECVIDYLNIAFPSGESRIYKFEIFTSLDKVSWMKVKHDSSAGLTNGLEEFDVRDSVAKYIRIVFRGSNVSLWNYVSQIEVFGKVVGTSIDVDDVSVDFGDLQVETSWISGLTSDRVSFNASEVDDQEWMDIEDSGVVMMTCLAPDSHRTELKERGGVEGSLDVYKKMSYTATLFPVPNHGITIAQVHNRQETNGVKVVRPWIRVYVDHDGFIKIKETNTTPDQDFSEYTVYPEVKSNWVRYVAGSAMNIVVEFNNGNAYFYIESGGKSYEEILTPNSDWDNYSEGYYLKAGVYTEGEDVRPIMKFSSFSMEYENF